MSARPELPMNPVAPVVIVLVALIAVVEAWVSLTEAGLTGAGQAAVGLRMELVRGWGFSPVIWEQVVGLGDRSFEMVRRFVTYAFVHGSFTHALFGGALLLALGKFVGDVFRWWAVLAVFLAGLLAGAVAFGLLIDGTRWLFGCYPGVYALIGAFSYILWLRLGQKGENRLRAFRLIGMLLIVQLVFAVLGPLIGGGFDPAFVADLAGFAAGFAVSSVVSPGGLAALRRRIQAR